MSDSKKEIKVGPWYCYTYWPEVLVFDTAEEMEAEHIRRGNVPELAGKVTSTSNGVISIHVSKAENT